MNDLAKVDRPTTEVAAAPVQIDPEMQLENMWLHGLSRHTRRAYVADLARFRQFIRVPIRDVTLGNLQDFVDHLQSLPLVPGSRHRIISGVKSFFAFAHRLGYLPFDASRALRLRGSWKDTLNERILSELEVAKLIDATASTGSPRAPRDRAIVVMLYFCGLRVSELLNLTWKDLAPSALGDQGWAAILGKGQKPRTVPIAPEPWRAIEQLRSHIAESGEDAGEARLFRLCASQVNRIIKAAAKRAGINKPVSAHWLRHCFCSHSLDHGAPLHLVQRDAGHSNISTTGRYLHVRPNESAGAFLRAMTEGQTRNPKPE